MARSAGVAVENNFTKGLVTQATGLNFPENACTETSNCIFDETGRVYRRLGFDYETNYTNFSVTRSSSVLSEFLWENAGGFGDLSFVVLQVGNTLYFYETSTTGALSPGKKSFTVSLITYKVAGAPNTNEVAAQFAVGKGYLFVTHPYCDPFYISYNADADTISSTLLTIEIRDFEGVEDGMDVEARLSTITNLHRYNVYNQGWYVPVEMALNVEKHNIGTSIAADNWRRLTGAYPSNTQVWWNYKGGENIVISQFQNRFGTGNSPAPKGHYILKAFYQDRSAASGVSGLAVVSSGYDRPSTVAFMAGRVFYGGVQAREFASKIYFTQIIERDAQLGQCYQTNDPTSEDLSTLLPTDGGVIIIPEMGTVSRMAVVNADLLVFASNGIWAISGSQGVGFTANDYSVRKISAIPTSAVSSFVNVIGMPIWWNSDGIYTVQLDKVTQSINIVCISDSTIKEYYDKIPQTSKKYAKGAYNSLNKTVQWVFRSSEVNNIDDTYDYDSILVLNTISGAFYPWTIPTGDNIPRINGIIATKGTGVSRVDDTVVTNANDPVTVSLTTNPVTVSVTASVSQASAFRYVTTTLVTGTTFNLTFTQENSPNYLDWTKLTTTGVDYVSNLVSGFKVHGDAIRKFQSNYIAVYSEVEDNSSLFMRARRNYANDSSSGKWSTQQQAYRNDTRYDYIHTRLKVLGTGTSMQLEFFSEAGKPFNIIGYSMLETANSAP